MSQPVWNIGFIDSCGERSVVSLPLPTITGANLDATLLKTVVTNAAVLAGKLVALSVCNAIHSSVSLPKVRQAETLPTAATAVRELGLMVSYQDNTTGKKYHFVIPGPDTSKLTPGTDNINPADSDWVALKAALEADIVSPDGNAITVIGGKLVGRNN